MNPKIAAPFAIWLRFPRFPSIWAGNQPLQVAESLAEVLLNMLSLDFVYLRLRGDSEPDEPEVVCTGRPQPRQIRRRRSAGACAVAE